MICPQVDRDRMAYRVYMFVVGQGEGFGQRTQNTDRIKKFGGFSGISTSYSSAFQSEHTECLKKILDAASESRVYHQKNFAIKRRFNCEVD